VRVGVDTIAGYVTRVLSPMALSHVSMKKDEAH
jgi:hypothetical protein